MLLTLYSLKLAEGMSVNVDGTDIPQDRLQKIIYNIGFKFLALAYFRYMATVIVEL